MKKFTFAFPFLLATLLLGGFAHGQPLDLRELDGEVLTFQVYWSGIHAAEAVLSAKFEPPSTMVFTSTATSLKGVRLFYPLDSKVGSRVDALLVRPLLYTKSGREGWSKQYDRKTFFDYEKMESNYYRDEKLRRTLTITPDVQDPLSSLYFYRTAKLADGEKITLKIDDGGKIVDSTVTVVRREKVTVPAGTFDAILVMPNTDNMGGVFAKSRGSPVNIWFTDDRYHRLIKMQSAVKVGDFTALLERIDPPVLALPAGPAAPGNPEGAAQ